MLGIMTNISVLQKKQTMTAQGEIRKNPMTGAKTQSIAHSKCPK